MQNNNIIIKGGTYLQIKKALEQWIELYIEHLKDKTKFKLFKVGSNEYRIKVDERLDNERFFFLINYLKYPEGIKYNVDVVGYTIGKDKNIFEANNLLVYIPENDDEYDNVYVVMEDNSTYKVDFNWSITEVEGQRSYSPPKITELFNPEIIKVDLNKKEKTNKINKENSIDKRYRIISIIAASVFVLGIFFPYFDEELLENFTCFYGFGLCIWFFMDYEMLQINKYFNMSFIISILFLFVIVMVNNKINVIETNLLLMAALSPISFLSIQKITRLLFIQIFKREPIPEKPSPSIADFIYTMILLFGFLLVPMFLMDIIK
jgi:hypothetical protein